MKLYIPYKDGFVDPPVDYVKSAKAWASELLKNLKAKMDQQSPVMYIVFLMVISDMAGNLLNEYMEDDFDKVKEMCDKTRMTLDAIAQKKKADGTAGTPQKLGAIGASRRAADAAMDSGIEKNPRQADGTDTAVRHPTQDGNRQKGG